MIDMGGAPPAGRKIEALYAWLIEHPNGGEGIIGIHTGEGWLPLVGSDLQTVLKLRDHAQTIGREQDMPVRLAQFRKRVDLE